MRVRSLVFLGALPVLAAAVSACGSNVKSGQTGTSTGAGGAGGSTTTTTTVVTTTTTTTIQDAGSDADNGMVSNVYPAFKPSVPQVLSFGGATMSAPKIVPVVFPNDSYQAQLTDFAAKLGASKWWNASTSEYGVGAATGLPAVALTEAAPTTIDDSAIQTWLAGKLNANDPAWPAADSNTIYMIHYPSTTTVTLTMQGQTATSCTEFGGYHNSTALANGTQATYAVVPTCSGILPGLTGIDELTGAASHELVEAATDPTPEVQGMQAYAQVDDAHLIWELALGGGEVGDMCAQFPGVFTKFSDLDYTVQRIWSNNSAAAYHDPCVSEFSGEVYFNTAPVLNDNVTISGIGTLKGVTIPVGSSGTVELDLFSEAATSEPWNVAVYDFESLMGGNATMTFALDQDSGQNGQKLHLTIDSLSAGQYGVGIFIVMSTIGQFSQTNPNQHWWVGLVGH